MLVLKFVAFLMQKVFPTVSRLGSSTPRKCVSVRIFSGSAIISKQQGRLFALKCDVGDEPIAPYNLTTVLE